MNLDKETEQFRERLDFFAESFIFSRDQMSVFFKTLGERLAATLAENETEEEVEAMVNETWARNPVMLYSKVRLFVASVSRSVPTLMTANSSIHLSRENSSRCLQI